LHRRIANRLNSALERWLPEQRLFLKSESGTRFLRLKPMTQAFLLSSIAALFIWSITVSSILLIDTISSGPSREQIARAQAAFESRLDMLSHERDARAAEAAAAQDRFSLALKQVSTMQSALLASEERRRELETGIEVIQATLRRTMREREAARVEALALAGELNGENGQPHNGTGNADDIVATLDFMTAALGRTALDRDRLEKEARQAQDALAEMLLEQRLLEQRNNEIFATLEGAVAISMEPMAKMFRAVGMNPDTVLAQIRRGYSGQGGPLGALIMSTKGNPALSEEEARAGFILDALDEMNMYRIAAEMIPFDTPVKAAHRFTSAFGRRWGRMHEGIDLAAPSGTPILATAHGTVTRASYDSGYGHMVEIKHEFGTVTRYAHLRKIHVKVGQKVSRGERIGDMGNTGRSTGTHLHYEVLVNGKPVNPMTFIKAASDVF